MAAGARLTCMIPNIETAWDLVLYVMQLCGAGFVVTSLSHQLILYTGFLVHVAHIAFLMQCSLHHSTAFSQ